MKLCIYSFLLIDNADSASNPTSQLQSQELLPCYFYSLQHLSKNFIWIKLLAAADLEMTIADLFHSENIPDRVVKSNQFKNLLDKSKMLDMISTYIIVENKIFCDFLFLVTSLTFFT